MATAGPRQGPWPFERSWLQQWQDVLDTMLLYGIKNPEQILQPIPMTRNLRVVGGRAQGVTGQVPSGSSYVYIGTQRYDERTLSYTTETATVTEAVLVYSSLNNREALEALVKLPMPALPVVPNFKAFSIDDSSFVNEVRYDSKLQILEIDLLTGGTYRYVAVPAYVVGEFLFTQSKGAFYNSRIKGNYGSQKV